MGLRVRPHDKHIWQPIAQTQATILYCAGKSGTDEFTRWAKQERRGNGDVALPRYFTEGFDAICRHVGLE